MIARLSQARPDDHTVVAQPLLGAAERACQLGQITAAVIANLDALGHPRDGALDVVLERVEQAVDVGWVVPRAKVRRITPATRLQAQRCPQKPYASGPGAKTAGAGATWSAVSLDGGARRGMASQCLYTALR